MRESNPKADSDEVKRRYATRAFPKNTLKDALRLAWSIQDNNGGQPYNKLDLAQSLEYSPESSGFRTLITSSSRYGLTQGSYKAEKISLEEIGRSIVAPRSDAERNEGILRALKNVEFFAKFFERFDQSKFPRDDLLKNTLIRDFDIPNEDVDDCLEILKRNLTDWGILVDQSGSMWLRLDKLSATSIPEKPAKEESALGPVIQGPPQPEVFAPKVFISHSKNQKILEQIKTILDFGQFIFVVAEDIETTSIPIPDKIFGLMNECNCAIISISADEREKNPDGSYRVNPNVLIEIGGAFLKYNRKVILLTDKRVDLPSNLQGLYRCEYEGDELSFTTALKLQKALAEFRKT